MNKTFPRVLIIIKKTGDKDPIKIKYESSLQLLKVSKISTKIGIPSILVEHFGCTMNMMYSHI